MSTYNGEKYLDKQLTSIMTQEDCEVYLFVRDDGSTDNSVNILEGFKEKYPNNVTVIKGHNIGYRKSFCELLKIDREYDYYAFSDQDDVWQRNKCITAIKKIEQTKKRGVLYASSTTITDSNLNKIGYNNITTSPNNIKSYFIRHRLAGCTMVFDSRIKNIAKKCIILGINNPFIDHDFLVGSIAYSFGTVIRDKDSYIFHRRSSRSVTSGGKGIIDRILTEKFVVFDRKNVNYDIALLINKYSDRSKVKLCEDSRKFLLEVLDYKDSNRTKMNILKDKSFTSGILVCDLEAKIKIVINNF